MRSICDVRDLRLVQREDVAEPFAPQVAQRLAQLPALVADDVRPELPVRALTIALLADALRHVQHDGDRQDSRCVGASSTSGLRASGCTFVASITTILRRRSRIAAR